MAFEVIEICAGAGGQALGLELAGFEHKLAIELDENACNTLRTNRSSWKVERGDVADPGVWKPSDYVGIDLLAGGVPCPPFTIAGKQLGATDERDLFAWAVEQVGTIKPKALLLENVRGLSMPRFAGYRQHVLDRLTALGYVAEWRLLHASDYGVPQLRPRFVLVALKADYAPYFSWPEPSGPTITVGEALSDLIGAAGWEGAKEWAARADKIAPTIVGGSKKHGGADLGPTRAKRAWRELGVDALGVANDPPPPGAVYEVGPKLTCEMVARIQGWQEEWEWQFTGLKTARYRQIGNAFPPPVARAVGKAIHDALSQIGPRRSAEREPEHDPIYRALRDSGEFMTHHQLQRVTGLSFDAHELERRIALLGRDFEIETASGSGSPSYWLGPIKAFLGQANHQRHEAFLKHRAKIS